MQRSQRVGGPRWSCVVLGAALGAMGCDDQVIVHNTGPGGASATSSGAGASGGAGGSSSGSNVTVGGGVGGGASTHSVNIGPFDVTPGDEQTLCVVVDAGNDAPGMLRSIRTHLTEGSHHMIVTKVDGGGLQPTPTPCSAFAHGGDSLFIAEKPEMSLTYPDGAGLPFVAHQPIGLELHFINYNPDPMQIEGVVEFDIVPESDDMKEVHLLFDGNLGISIPPQSQRSFESDHFVPAGAQVFAVTSHTHRLGVYASVHKTGSGGDELLHESDSWSEPPFDVFDPSIPMGQGDAFRLRCDYDNTTNETVNFGVGFYDEMCFLWAHYTLD